MTLGELVKDFIASDAKRWDVEWESFKCIIYWVGTIIRIDLKPRGE